MVAITGLWPIAVIEDRYNGTYSGGAWFAVANADYNAFVDLPGGEFHVYSRAGWIMACNGPHDGDTEASGFWDDAPSWIAAGNTPDEAIAALRAKVK